MQLFTVPLSLPIMPISSHAIFYGPLLKHLSSQSPRSSPLSHRHHHHHCLPDCLHHPTPTSTWCTLQHSTLIDQSNSLSATDTAKMSVELPIRIPIQSMPSLSNVEGIQTVLEDMLSDHEHSDSAMAVHDLTQATLTSAKALPCIIVHKDEPENVKRFSADPPSPSASGWGAYSKKTSIAASPPPSASAWGDHLLAPNSPRLSRSSAQGWVGVPKSGPGDNWSETSFAIGHIKIIVRDAMMRCHTFQLARDSTLTILTKLYGQRIGMDLEVTRCLWAKLNSQQQFNSQQYGLSLQTVSTNCRSRQSSFQTNNST